MDILAPLIGRLSMAGVHQAGTSPLECWYNAGVITGGLATSTGAMVANTLFALPLWVAEAMTLDRLAINVTTAASSTNTRIGIYAATSLAAWYPSALVLDAGAVDTGTTGVKSLTISQALAGGRPYWLALLSSGTPTFRGSNNVWTAPILGTDSTLPATGATALTVAQTYGALPSTFPSGGGRRTVATPMVFWRRSA
jgi:hypothetical protein